MSGMTVTIYDPAGQTSTSFCTSVASSAYVMSAGPGTRHEDVPSYEDAPKDPCAVAYKLTRKDKLYTLSCDTTHEFLHFHGPNASEVTTKPKKKQTQEHVDITYTAAEAMATTKNFAQVSGIQRKKFNLASREPVVYMISRHGSIPLTLFRGNYCGFTNAAEDVEFFWQLRNTEARASSGLMKTQFKDAVLRRTVRGQKSSMAGMYMPNPDQHAADTPDDDDSQTDGDEGDAESGQDPKARLLGRLLVRSDLCDFDKDMALTSFVAVLVRVIEAEKRTAFGNGLIRAMTIGEG